jgi:hypothetical protein
LEPALALALALTIEASMLAPVSAAAVEIELWISAPLSEAP